MIIFLNIPQFIKLTTAKVQLARNVIQFAINYEKKKKKKERKRKDAIDSQSQERKVPLTDNIESRS